MDFHLMALPPSRIKDCRVETVGSPSVLQEHTSAPDFDSQDDPLFLQVNSQEIPAPATKDFHSQDDPLFLQVAIPPCHLGTPAFECASADISPNVMTSSVNTGIDHSYTHQTGKGSTVQKDSMIPTGNSILQPSCHTPSHPVTKVSPPSVTKIEQPSNVYSSRLVYHLQGELKSLGSCSEMKDYPIDLSKTSFINVSNGPNEVGGFTSIPASTGQAFPLKTLRENTNNVNLVSDNDVQYLYEISHNPSEREAICATKDVKSRGRDDQPLKFLRPGGMTGVSSNSAEVSTFQSSKCVDKRRQVRYSIYENNSKYLSKVGVNENHPGDVNHSTCFPIKDNLNSNENINGRNKEGIPVYMIIRNSSTYSSKRSNLDSLENTNSTKNYTPLVHGDVPNYHLQTLVNVCNIPFKTVGASYLEKQNNLAKMNMLTHDPTFHASDSAVMNVCDEQINSSGLLKKRNHLSTQCGYNDHQSRTICDREINLSDRIPFFKVCAKKEKVTVLSNQQKINSSDEMTDFCLPVQQNNQFLASKDTATSSVPTKNSSAISKEEGKDERNAKNSNQHAKKSNKSGKEKSKALEMYNKAELVYFDLETGGLFIGVDILQIAAVSNGRAFMQYVTPTRNVNPAAQDINGLKNENGTLMKRTSRMPLTWEPLETLPIEKSLRKFLDWLDDTGPCFLVAHNANFDKKHIVHHINMSGLHGEFQKRVFGFIDTLPFFRAMFPELKKPGPGHRQEVLVKHVLQETYNAHDALEDVKSLQKLVKKVEGSLSDLLKHKLHF